MTGGSHERGVDRKLSTAQKKGEELPRWFPSVAKRVEESIPLLRPLERRMLDGKTGLTESERSAAQSAKNILQEIERNKTVALENYSQLSKAFEVFVALGIRGKMIDPSDPKSKPIPGWLGQTFPEVSLSDPETDIHYGMDFLVRMMVDGEEVILGGDATFSDKKLDEKFARNQTRLSNGSKTPIASDPQGPGALRVVVGISNEQMREALMAWGRDTNRVEAYEARALGACVREQIATQLQKSASFTRESGHEMLAKQYEGVLQKIAKVAPHVPERRQSLAGDSLHQNILAHTKNIGNYEGTGK